MNQFDLLFLPIEIRYLKLCIMLADIYKVAICDLKRKKRFLIFGGPSQPYTLPRYHTNLPNKKNILIYHAQTDM